MEKIGRYVIWVVLWMWQGRISCCMAHISEQNVIEGEFENSVGI